LTERDLQDTCHFYSFVRLDVINSTQDTVEFKALLLHDNVIETLHENSKFVIENGRWCYDSGEIKEVAPLKLTRNDKCPCGSGSKFKQCHMK
jgi:SEC-C motif-containing protein